MMKATIGDQTVEVWFTPSYNIKGTSPEIVHYLRKLSYRTYDPIAGVMRDVRIDKSELDAFLLVQFLKFNTKVPIEFLELPRVLTDLEPPPEGAEE